MFSSSPNYTKLKTNLRLSVNRLKLLEKKKTELAQKSRKEIAEYLGTGKIERAKIRVEHIIREDYLVEAMEIVEMYCDLLLARFGLLTQMKELDSGIAEPVASLIWVAPRLQSDVQELKIISELLTAKYGKIYAEQARTATGEHQVSEKLMHKLAVQAPPKLLVEKYLIEIAKIYHIEYDPDPQVMQQEESLSIGGGGMLIDLSDRNNLGGGGSGGGVGGGSGGFPQPVGFIGYPLPPALPNMPMTSTNTPFAYPSASGGGNGGGGSGNIGGASAPLPFNYNIPPHPQDNKGSLPEKKDLNINTEFLKEEISSLPPAYSTISPDDNLQNLNKPKPQPRSKMQNNELDNNSFFNLPSVPTDLPDLNNRPGGSGGGNVGGGNGPNNDFMHRSDEIDFDDLSRRFDELTKKNNIT